MGVFCNFCVICGGPFDNSFMINWDDDDNGRFEEFEKNLVKTGNIKIEDNCGKYATLENSEWMNNILIVTLDGKILETDNADCGISTYKKDKYIITPMNWEKDVTKNGICCHKSCYNLLKTKFSYELKPILNDKTPALKDISKEINDITSCLPSKLYEDMNTFSFDQEFYLKPEIMDYLWLFDNPINVGKNQDRIVKMWRSLLSL